MFLDIQDNSFITIFLHTQFVWMFWILKQKWKYFSVFGICVKSKSIFYKREIIFLELLEIKVFKNTCFFLIYTAKNSVNNSQKISLLFMFMNVQLFEIIVVWIIFCIFNLSGFFLFVTFWTINTFDKLHYSRIPFICSNSANTIMKFLKVVGLPFFLVMFDMLNLIEDSLFVLFIFIFFMVLLGSWMFQSSKNILK